MYSLFVQKFNKLDFQHKYRVSSIAHNSGIVGYQRNFGIDPGLIGGHLHKKCVLNV